MRLWLELWRRAKWGSRKGSPYFKRVSKSVFEAEEMASHVGIAAWMLVWPERSEPQGQWKEMRRRK